MSVAHSHPHLLPCRLDSVAKDSNDAGGNESPTKSSLGREVTGSAFPEKHLCSSGSMPLD